VISVYFNPHLNDDAVRDRLYAGNTVILPASLATQEFIKFAKEMFKEGFAPRDPRFLNEVLPAAETEPILGRLKPKFIHYPHCKTVSQVMAERGIDREKLYFDVPRMGSAYPLDYLQPA
jgi:hypothetical protein